MPATTTTCTWGIADRLVSVTAMAQRTTSFQDDYWNGPGGQKTFTHPVRWGWLDGLATDASILDYGSGYGRLVAEFTQRGHTGVRGVDPAATMVHRGVRDGLALQVMVDPPSVPDSIPPADLVLLFAVLTCVPSDDDQRALIAAAWQAVRPGGLLYIADFLQIEGSDRYRTMRPDSTPYGTFTTSDGAVLRHHTSEHLDELVGGRPVRRERLALTTMNGNAAAGYQLLARKE